MSRFTGPQGRGAKRRLREQKRAEAETRNKPTQPATEPEETEDPQ